MRKREPERRSTKSFAQDRGSTGFLRMVLRAHNASAHVPERGRKRSLRKRKFDKKPSEGVFEGVLRQKQRSKGSSRSPYCLLGAKVKRSTAVCGAANKAGQRARVELRTSLKPWVKSRKGGRKGLRICVEVKGDFSNALRARKRRVFFETRS